MGRRDYIIDSILIVPRDLVLESWTNLLIICTCTKCYYTLDWISLFFWLGTVDLQILVDFSFFTEKFAKSNSHVLIMFGSFLLSFSMGFKCFWIWPVSDYSACVHKRNMADWRETWNGHHNNEVEFFDIWSLTESFRFAGRYILSYLSSMMGPVDLNWKY